MLCQWMARILIVDDEKAVRRMLAVAFSKAGYEVQIAAHVPEAIALLGVESVDVVLSDVVMNALSGHDLVRWVAAHHPAVTCVLMTGFDDTGCDSCPFVAGCPRLPKPFDAKEAVAAVAEALRERSK
jgi:DNA-binding NtrC family response regulator